jgi:hypothetical protein
MPEGAEALEQHDLATFPKKQKHPDCAMRTAPQKHIQLHLQKKHKTFFLIKNNDILNVHSTYRRASPYQFWVSQRFF